MSGLMTMQKYVFTTAKVLSSVLDKEVVICDNAGNIVGDSLYENPEDFKPHKVTEESMLIQAMKLRKTIRKYAIHDTVQSCLCCKKKTTCDINSIIAYPMISLDEVIGAIGLYSNNDKFFADEEKEDFFNEFLEKISELIISKAEESRYNDFLTVSNSRLESIIEHIDLAVCSLNEKNVTTCCNKRFIEMFELHDNQSNINVDWLLGNKEFQKLLNYEGKHAYSDILFHIGKKKVYTYTTINKFFWDNGEYAGAIIYFKPMENYIREYHRFTDSSAAIYFDDIIGDSHVLRKIKENAYRFAQNNSNILLLGESGTGKELFARAIHNASRRSDKAFITINCAAIPDNLLESELFGYEEGAFTGSIKGGKLGKFQLADKGTIFLDEIGELPLHLQAKLLRAIQERRITKIGGVEEIDVDIRVIAATNRDLDFMVKNGEFREDLYYRLSVAPLKIPSLRERKTDIAELCEYFVRKCSKTMGKNIEGINREALSILEKYDWPGNVRELQNAIEFAANMTDTLIIGKEHLPRRVLENKKSIKIESDLISLKDMEQCLIQKALDIYGTDAKGKEMAAEALGIGIATLYRKIKEY